MKIEKCKLQNSSDLPLVNAANRVAQFEIFILQFSIFNRLCSLLAIGRLAAGQGPPTVEGGHLS